MKRLILFSLLILFSCSNSNTTKEFYEDGSLKKEYTLINRLKEGEEKIYYESGNLKTLKQYFKGILKDSVKTYYDDPIKKIKKIQFNDDLIIEYYKNGKIFSKGKLNTANQRVGEWRFYTKNGLLSEIREYLIIDGQSYVNQLRYISRDGEYWLSKKDQNFNYYDQEEFVSDTVSFQYSRFTEFDLGKDTINLNEPWRAVAFYYTPIFEEKKSELIIVLGKNDKIFNEDFSNIKEVEKDTFFNLSRDVENQKWFPEDDPDYTVVFGRWFDTPGEKTIRGYLCEFFDEQKKDTIRAIESKIFFEKKIYVKDTIE